MFGVTGYKQMKPNWVFVLLVALVFFLASFLILLDQYLRIGVWFQIGDIHHETFAIAAFAAAIGILIGAVIKKK
jgi:hypothetical protein